MIKLDDNGQPRFEMPWAIIALGLGLAGALTLWVIGIV
jgi:hypothetical protein